MGNMFFVRLWDWCLLERLESKLYDVDPYAKIVAISMNSKVALIRSYASIFDINKVLDVNRTICIMDDASYIKLSPDTLFNFIEELSKDKE